MANRVATSGDVTTYATWTSNNIDGDAVTQYDLIWDTYTNPTPKGIFINTVDEDTTFSESLTGAASGNDSGDADFVVTTTISTSRPSVGAFKVADGLGGYDVYKYSSFSGSTFTLDATEHPSGLVRTYAGSEQVWSPYLRISFTTWLDSGTFHNDISYYNATYGQTSSILMPSSAPAHLRPLNGRIKFNRRNDEASNLCLEADVDGAFIIDGELRSVYPGLRHGITDIYVWNQFGFWLTDLELNRNVRMCSITGDNLTGAGFRGVCVFHGFSGFRAARTNNNQELEFLTLERCASLFGLGERVYLLQTTDNAGNPIAKKVNIKENIYAYSFNEGHQVQNIASTAGESYIKNWVSYANALAWKFAFQNNQDTGVQWEIQDADNGNYIGDGIIEGWASYGLQFFSSDKTARGFTAGSGIAKINNIAMLGGRQTGLRKHGSTQYGPETEWRDIYVFDINDTINELSVESTVSYWMESADETVTQHLIDVTYNTGKSEFFATSGSSTSFSSTIALNLTTDDTLPQPQYMSNGFDGLDIEKLEAWNDEATQDTGSPNITYNAGDYVINAVLDGEYAFYYVENTHTVSTGTANRPDNDATNYTKVTWDESGVRSNEAGWSSGDTQSDYPPCDFRLVQDSFWSNLKMGLNCQPTRSDRTQYQWQYSKDDSTWYNVGEGREYSLDTNNLNYLSTGDYVRLKVTFTNGTSTTLDSFQLS